MPKSNYPNKLDSSIEIPAVRDNIIEVGSDVLNSMRSALFQIERTLGINPQGAAGNTVADRLNRVLDGNGNFLKESFDRADLLSGPITNEEVAKNAAISESKLRLNYPTNLLQDEISQLINQVDTILVTVEELAVLFNAHVHTSAVNRHKGLAITIDAIDSSTSSDGITSIPSGTAQDAFDTIFSSHINYDGSDISISNRSHEAEQLFFDTTDVSSYIDSDDVQGAIEEILTYAVGQLDEHQNIHHDNGISRTGELTTAMAEGEGLLLLDTMSVQYNARNYNDTAQDAIVNFSSNQELPDLAIKRSDILEVTDSTGVYTYQISKAVYSEDETELIGVMVFARFGTASEDGATARIYQNINAKANYGGLLTSVREYEGLPGHTNADTLQVANPNAATIITRGIRPSEITGVGIQSNRYFSISVNGASAVTLDVYDSGVAVQTIDTILKKLNEQFASNGLSVAAYRVDYDEDGPSEIALVHSIESTVTSSYTLMVSRGDDDAIDSLGLTPYEDFVVDATLGTNYYIQGKAHSGLGHKLAETGLELLAGTEFVTSSSLDFAAAGIVYGDLLIIANSNSDDGTYMIQSVNTTSDGFSQFGVDSTQLDGGSWSGETSAETEFYVLKNSISLKTLEFDELVDGSSKTVVADVFMDYDRNIFYNRRLEYSGISKGSVDHLVAIVDFYGDISPYSGLADEGLYMELSAGGNVLLSLDGGNPLELSGLRKSYVEIKSGKYDVRLRLYIEDSSELAAYVTVEGATSILIYGYDGINEEENLFLSRIHYESAVSRISGAGTEYPRTFSKLRRGTTGRKDLGSDAIFATQQRPLLETRSNGVIQGLNVSTAILDAEDLHASLPDHESINVNGHYVINISGGVCYVKGKRFEIGELSNLVTGVASPAGTGATTDKFFVALDQWGGLVFASAVEGPGGLVCESPFDPYDYCVLCTVEYNGNGLGAGDPPVATDLRLFIDQLDLKLLNSITVSPQRGMGHFTSINEALKYAKRFSQAYSSAGIPTIHLKSGVHRVDVDTGLATTDVSSHSDLFPASVESGIYINFPVNMVGEGDSTVLDLTTLYSDNEDDKTEAPFGATRHGIIYIAGPGLSASAPELNPAVIEAGFVNLSNFKMRLSRIALIDPAIKDLDDNNLNWGVNINNVVFDFSEFSTPQSGDTFGLQVVPIDAEDDSTDADPDYFGNIAIEKCQFLNSSISIEVDAALCRNINISNNVFRGTGDGEFDGADNYAISQIFSLGHIFDFEYCPAVNNVQIFGNINADNDGSVGHTAFIDRDGNYEWGDRISRRLSVGGVTELHSDLWAYGDFHATGPISITTDDDESEYGLTISKGNNNSYKMIKLENRDASGTAVPDWRLHHIDDGSFSIDTGTAHNRLRLAAGSPHVGLNTDSPKTFLHIKTHASDNVDAASDALLDKYHLLLHDDTNTDGREVGLAFRISEGESGHVAGAAITHERTGTSSKGKLRLKTKTSTSNTSGLSTSMTLDDNGFVGIGTLNPNRKLSIHDTGGDATVSIKEGEDAASGPDLHFYKFRYDPVTFSNTSSQTDDNIGNIQFHKSVNDGLNDVDYESVALIQCKQTAGGGGELRLRTGATGGSTSTRLKVEDDGNIDMMSGRVDIGGKLRVNTTQTIGQVNINHSSDIPGLYINSGGAEIGDIVSFRDNGGANSIGIGSWDVDDNDGSRYGSRYHETVKINTTQGRVEIFQENMDSGSGLRFHSPWSTGGQTWGGAMGKDERWTIHFRDMATGGDGERYNVLAFHFKDQHDAGDVSYTDGLRGFLRSDNNAQTITFTGQHRSVADAHLYDEDKVGLIVVSNGLYHNLDGTRHPSINESLPEVCLSLCRNDKRVFGVISGIEDSNSETREYSVGTFVSCYQKADGDNRLIINSLGEGAIWVCNINGNLEGGDYIASCEIPGYGMRQDDDLLHNYTVAKITQDCDFDLNSNVYDCVEFDFEGQTYKKAFVGCTYHCG